MLASLAMTPFGAIAAEKGGGSSASGTTSGGAGIEVGYHPGAQVWVQGKKSAATYYFSGSTWLVYATRIDGKVAVSSKTIMPPTLALWGDTLKSKYSTKDPSGGTASEIIKTQGLGVGLIDRYISTGVCVAFVVGLERAFVSQSGDTPRSQRYPFGLGGRAGLGWSLFNTTLSPYLRADYVFKHFPAATWNHVSLKPIQAQSFVPSLGFSLSY
jgi:hypothetical protein